MIFLRIRLAGSLLSSIITAYFPGEYYEGDQHQCLRYVRKLKMRFRRVRYEERERKKTNPIQWIRIPEDIGEQIDYCISNYCQI
jgi:hypothetical protein